MNATSRRADAAALAGRLRAPNPARRASLDNATQAIGADTRPPRGERKGVPPLAGKPGNARLLSHPLTGDHPVRILATPARSALLREAAVPRTRYAGGKGTGD